MNNAIHFLVKLYCNIGFAKLVFTHETNFIITILVIGIMQPLLTFRIKANLKHMVQVY